MTRLLLFCMLWALGLAAQGSDLIPMPPPGGSARVQQPHVTAELIPETTHLAPGKPFLVALHLHMDENWHTYWVNPGDAGLATTIKWTLPAGFSAGPIQWPTPELHMMGPLTTYGYGGDVYLLTTITPPAKIAAKTPLEIKAHATWLVCQEECIPGQADLQYALQAPNGTAMTPAAETFFTVAKSRLPAIDAGWTGHGSYQGNDMVLEVTANAAPKAGGHLYFYPEQGNVIDPKEDVSRIDSTHPAGGFTWPLTLQQNGEKLDHLSGVLVSDQPLASGGAKAIDLPSFAVSASAPVAAANTQSPVTPTASTPATSPSPSLATKALAPTPAAEQPWLLAVLGAAFLGGLILNLMPCVLPVLSLKVFSLIKHAGENPKTAWRQGAAFTAGVVISFWILAGLLIGLRAAGNHLGWGFQMQSPGFVLALIFLFFLLGLNLFGVFELGASLVGLDAKATGRVGHGLTSSFLNGALATLAATPCTAPFMGSALGFAAQQSLPISLLIFTCLAVGMATPYLLLTVFPGALRFVPKPGAWMEAFKQFMGFLLLATVIFLLYVFGALVGQDQIPGLLAALLIAGIAAWIYGRWAAPGHGAGVRFAAVVLALGCLVYAGSWGIHLARATPPEPTTQVNGDTHGWQPWSPSAVDAARAQNRPVFVDFTAAWCLSCKVNERVALETDAVKQAFAQKNVALFRADWTHADPAISATLQQYHRDGVPLYLVYSPKAKDAPRVLPEVLTPDLVLDALHAL